MFTNWNELPRLRIARRIVVVIVVVCWNKQICNYLYELHLLQGVLRTLLSEAVNNQALLRRFEEYTTYDDVRYYCLKHVHTLCRNCHKQVIWQDWTLTSWVDQSNCHSCLTEIQCNGANRETNDDYVTLSSVSINSIPITRYISITVNTS